MAHFAHNGHQAPSYYKLCLCPCYVTSTCTINSIAVCDIHVTCTYIIYVHVHVRASSVLQMIICLILLALAVYSRSPAAYEALKSFKLVQLPSVRTLKYHVDANLEGAGESTSRIIQSRKEYIAMVEEVAKEKAEKTSDPGRYKQYLYWTTYTRSCCTTDKKVLLPLSKGTLIIDEVKVYA